MKQSMVIQGRNITTDEIGLILDLMAQHRDWGRTRLSEELAGGPVHFNIHFVRC